MGKRVAAIRVFQQYSGAWFISKIIMEDDGPDYTQTIGPFASYELAEQELRGRSASGNTSALQAEIPGSTPGASTTNTTT